MPTNAFRGHEFQFLDFSSAITRSGITAICPKPRFLMNIMIIYLVLFFLIFHLIFVLFSLVGGWLFPIMPFTTTMWIAVVVSFIGLLITYIVIRRFQFHFKGNSTKQFDSDIAGIWLQIWGLYLSQSNLMQVSHTAQCTQQPVIVLLILFK